MYFDVQHVCNMDASKNPQNINLVYRIVTKKNPFPKDVTTRLASQVTGS